MRICFYSGVFARQGGIEEFTKDLALTLRAAGVEVGILCASLRNPVLEELREAGVDIIALPFFWGCRWNVPDYALFPLALLKLKKYDAVIHQKPFKSGFYPWLSHKPKHIFLTAYHPDDQFKNSDMARNFFSFFDAIVTQSEGFRQALLRKGVEVPVHVIPLIPPAVTAIQTEKIRAEGLLRIGMMGRLENQKNPHYGMEIVHALSRQHLGYSEIEFNVYGSGTLLGELQQRAEDLGVNAIFHGRYDRQSVPEIVFSNDLFLITSISEGQCIVALEILAGGRPLFATPVGALPDILEDGIRGTLLTKDDDAESANRIIGWFDDHFGRSTTDIQDSYGRTFDRKKVKARYVKLITEMVLFP